MTFYRLQSTEYDITSGSRSFNTCYDSLDEAMEEDIKVWIIGYETDEHWIDLDDYAIENTNVFERYNNTTDYEALWNELINEGYEPIRVHKGISCYEEDRKEELIEYFEYHRPYNSESILDAYGDPEDYYVLVFEGKHVGCGTDDEDLAVYHKEIKKMNLEDFMKECC